MKYGVDINFEGVIYRIIKFVNVKKTHNNGSINFRESLKDDEF